MSRLGGCTKKGEIFWRMEDKQVVSTLVDGWFRESSPDHINVRANKKSILMGSLGIGKSTLLCVLAFHLVFKHTKNVLVYRRLAKSEQESCLLYLGYEGDKVVYFSLSLCDESEAKFFYRVLRGQHGVSNVWLLLDGYRYQDIPEGVRTFKMLATSQQVDLTSRERIHAYCCLMPCWSKKDLWLMGDLIYKFATEDMEERFYYSGGSVHEFTLPTPEDIRSVIDAAISGVDDVSNLLSNMTERAQSDRLRHTFVKNSDDTSQFTVRRYWEQVIDSEYAVLGLSVRLTSDALFRIYTWAKSAGHGSLVESVFEIYLHRLAADNTLSLYISEYDPPKRRQPNEERHLKMKPVVLRNGGAICCGTASNHENDLKKWRDDDTFTYWFPACHDFPNINSIVKLESASSKKSNVAYLHFTAAADREIDGEQLRKMNTIFFPDDVEGADDTEPPIYIAVCPDLKSCETFVLKPPPQVLAARKTCRVYVGYYWAATLDLPPPPMFR
ncbi:hypothetical protein PHYPSEUDO_013995 [Phytophthora pseudosyringae]|uniref:Crinkler (CRN) family protein n=1 Tax=Phytophthora pseudosyringae TaxID=221518 RepID=A0A8T1V4P2_9STRA|nr:hypothetical protein PHYPSEUDO_013995 [Phytophthora pseudosyringae]